MNRKVLSADVELSDEGVGFHQPGGYWGTLPPPRAQALAVEILARWPLERCERETLPDWKADASRYVKDPNMLTRRFARRVVALVDGFEEALVELSAHAAVQSELAACKPDKPAPRKPAKPELQHVGLGKLRAEVPVTLLAREAKLIEVVYRHVSGVWPRRGDELVVLGGPALPVQVVRSEILPEDMGRPSLHQSRRVDLMLVNESERPVRIEVGFTWTVSVAMKGDEDETIGSHEGG